MFDLRDLRPGLLFWCDTARNGIGQQFSDKEFRPVLVVSVLAEYGGVAVYPCSRLRDLEGRSDQISESFGEVETHIVYGMGLFLIQPDDLHPPTAPWSEWSSWRQTHRRVIEDDLRILRHHQSEQKPRASSASASTVLNTRLSDTLNAETLARLEKLRQSPPPPPKPPDPPPAPKPKLPPKPPIDLFKQAVDSILPYHILRTEDEVEDEPPHQRGKSPKRKRK
jgi:hypothetical protein